jgi:hypothetical protein
MTNVDDVGFKEERSPEEELFSFRVKLMETYLKVKASVMSVMDLVENAPKTYQLAVSHKEDLAEIILNELEPHLPWYAPKWLVRRGIITVLNRVGKND